MKHARARFTLASAALCLALACALIGDTALAAGTQTAWTLAGTGIATDSGDGGQAREAAINQPRSVFPTANGGYVWAEPWSNKVRIVGPDGVIDTLAGTGASGFDGDGGSAEAAKLNFVHAAAPTPDGGYLLADELNNRIRKVAANGVITTVAGNGSAGYSGDGGAATAAAINNPRGVVSLPDGGFLIPDSNNHRVRKVSASGIITTVAGTGVQGFAGDQGQATSAQLSIPFGVAPTADGGFLIVDIGNGRIREVSAAGVITTVAGNGTDGYSGDGGPATAASLAAPHNVVATSGGGFLIADAGNQRVRQVGADGVITTLIGDGVRGYSGDGGPASAAQLSVPKAVGLTAAGDMLIADEQNNRIRFVGTVSIPTNTSPPTISGNATQGQQLTAKAGGWGGTGPLIDYQWQRCSPGCANISGATNSTYLVAAADVGATLRVAVTGSNSAGSETAYSAQTGVVSGAAGTPPSNTSPPTVSGVAQLGQTLTASAGSWSGTAPISYTYQWRRCDAGGSGCVDIGGAVGSSYPVAAADVGSTLRVAVTASNGSSVYASAVSGSAPRSYWRFGGSSGALVDEQGVSNGSFVGNPQRGVSGLLVGDPDVAVDFNGTSQYADVPAAAAWTPPAFSIELTVRPSELPDNRTIWSTQGSFNGWWLNTGPSGNVRMFVGDGSAWRSQSGPVLNAGSRYHLLVTYDGTNARLYVNGALVSTGPNATMAPNGGANVMRFGDFSTGPGQHWPGTLDDASFYPAVLSASQVQAHYDASITGSLATSAATAVVTTVAPVNTSPPTISGPAQQGQTLTADPGSWSGTAPISYSYQWQRCSPGCANISGATNSTYLVAAADVGATLRVAVTGSNSAGSETAYSAQTGVVSGAAGTPPSNTSPPTVSGVAQLGQTLTASAGSWSGTAPISYTYQWRRCDAGGSGCVDIGGAVGSSYPVAAADVGSTLRVAVTASNGSSVYASAVSGSAPRSYWRFGGSSGALVDEQGVSNGSFVGNPQRGVSGLLVGDPDVAVDFNGTSQYADVPAAAAWTPPAFSIELTVRPSELPDNRTIWSTQGSFNGWWLNTGPSGNVRMFVGDGSAWRSQSGPVLNAGSRYHLLVTYDGTNARLYVNGALVSTGPNATMAPNGGANVMRFGDFSTGPGQHWPGTLDDASFYPAVLSASQVQAHYDASITGSLATSAATAVVTTVAPVNTSPPTISGPAQQGQTLTADPGSWSGTAPISYSYQWQRCSPGCANISGATNSTYLVAAADVGATLRVAVTATNSSGSSQASSSQTAVVTAPGTENTVTFDVATGTDDGDVKANNMGTGAPYPPATTPIANATATTFAVRRSGPVFSGYEVRVGVLRFDTSALPDGATVTGATLRLYVTGTESDNGRNLVGEWYSAANWPIDSGDYTFNAAATAHTGTPISSLTVNSQNNFALQNLVSISTTGSTGLRLHVAGGAPNGENNVFFNSFENNNNNRPKPQLTVTYTTTSGGTAPSNTTPPSVSGTAQQGQTLTADPGTWSGTAPISYGYQWQRCSPGCANISTATNTSYLIAAADVGSTLRVSVTGTNSAGSSEGSSTPTAVVTAASGTESTITFSVAAGADDGDVKANNMGSGAPYPPATTPSANSNAATFAVRRSGPVFSGYEVRVGLLRFDTSALPDGAVVTGATLRLYVTGRESSNARGLVGEWYGSSNWPIDAGDYALNAASTAHAGTPILSLTEDAQNNLTLQNLASVSRTGFTGLRLHVDGAAPNGENNVFFTSFDNNNRPEPQLIVTYTNP